MKYPYIGKWEYINTTVIFTDENAGIEIGGEMSFRDDWTEINYKNITAEYLANTYGEVKSKEHAEFIVKLAEVNGFRLCNPKKTDKKWFCFDDNELYFFDDVENASDLDEKQITIPLPPTDTNTNTPEEDFEMKQIAKNNDDYLDTCASEILDVLYSDLPSVEKRSKQLEILAKYIVKECESRIIDEPEENAGMNLIFGGDDKCKEWPCVNDEVLTSDGKGVVRLLSDSKGYYVVSINNEYYQYQIDELSKPKTPAQELRDEIINCIHNHNEIWRDNNNEMEVSVYEFVGDALLSKYNITKKPQ